MYNLWVELTDKIKVQKKSFELKDEVFFYIE